MRTGSPLASFARSLTGLSWVLSAATTHELVAGLAPGRPGPSRGEAVAVARRTVLSALAEAELPDDVERATAVLRRTVVALHDGLMLGGALGVRPSREQRRADGGPPRVAVTGDPRGDLAAVLATLFEQTTIAATVLQRMDAEQHHDPPLEPAELCRELSWLVERSLDPVLADAEVVTAEAVVAAVSRGVLEGLPS
jgi:hypothetical protein